MSENRRKKVFYPINSPKPKYIFPYDKIKQKKGTNLPIREPGSREYLDFLPCKRTDTIIKLVDFLSVS